MATFKANESQTRFISVSKQNQLLSFSTKWKLKIVYEIKCDFVLVLRNLCEIDFNLHKGKCLFRQFSKLFSTKRKRWRQIVVSENMPPFWRRRRGHRQKARFLLWKILGDNNGAHSCGFLVIIRELSWDYQSRANFWHYESKLENCVKAKLQIFQLL